MIPPPPEELDPVWETLTAGTVLYRVHNPQDGGQDNDGTLFNPGFGRPTRFAFFGTPPVAVLYAAADPAGAVHESILHDAEPGGVIPKPDWQDKLLTPVRLAADVRVASFHSDGLRRLDLFACNLTDTPSTTYAQTVQWADSAHTAGAAGISYMCRHHNTSKAVCLFGDRVPVGALKAEPEHEGHRVFRLPQDADWLNQIALQIRVTILN